MCYWKQWKKIKTRHDNLVKLGIDYFNAWNIPIQEKTTGESPIALHLQLPLIIRDLRILDTLVLQKDIHKLHFLPDYTAIIIARSTNSDREKIFKSILKNKQNNL